MTTSSEYDPGRDVGLDELEPLDVSHQEMLVRPVGEERSSIRYYAVVCFCVLLFVGIRIAVLKSNVLFTDHDSVSFLTSIRTIAGQTPPELEDRSADFLPLYPYFGAAISGVTGLSPEHSAQTASLIVTTLGFLAVLAIAKIYFSDTVVLVAGILISVCPKLAQLDTSMLTDPMYVGLVYIGLYLYERQRAAASTMVQAGLLGVVFGLAFLTRSEAILFVAIVPTWHFVSLWWNSELREWPKGLGWSAVFLVVFGLVVSWHVWSVSQKMGTFALNGRQAWLLLLNEPTDADYDERLRGLRFIPEEINLTYLMANPEAAEQLARPSFFLKPHIKNSLFSLSQLFDFPIHMLPGPINMMFGGVGLLCVLGLARFRRFGLFVLLCLALLVPGIVYAAFSVRYLLIIMPAVMICSAVGVVEFMLRCRRFSRWLPARDVAPLEFPAVRADAGVCFGRVSSVPVDRRTRN